MQLNVDVFIFQNIYLKTSPHGIQFDEQQAFSAGEVQLIAYCRFADDEKTKTIVILDNVNTSTHFKFSEICHFKPAKKRRLQRKNR